MMLISAKAKGRFYRVGRRLLILVFLLCEISLSAQKIEYDNLAVELQWFNQKIIHEEFSDPEGSAAALDSLHSFALESGDDRRMAWYWYYRGYKAKNATELDSAQLYLEKVIAHGDNDRWVDHALMQNGYNALGNVYSYRGDSESELECHFLALPYARASGLVYGIATTTYNIGKVLTKRGSYLEAIPYVKECLEIDLQLNDSLNIALDFVAIANLHSRLDEHDEALKYLREAILFANEKGHPIQYVKVLNSLAVAELENGTKDKVRPMIEKALEVAHQQEDTLGIITSMHALAKMHHSNGAQAEASKVLSAAHDLSLRRGNQEAQVAIALLQSKMLSARQRIRLLEEMMPTIKLVGRKELLGDARDQLIESYRQIGNDLAVISLQDSTIAYLENSSKAQVTQATQSFDLRLQLAETERNLEVTTLRNEFQEKSLKNQRIGLALAALTLLILSWLVYRLFQKNKLIASQKEDIEKAFQEKDTLLREIHHRVKNNLQVISSLLSLQGRHSKNPQVVDAIRKGKDRVRSMSLIHQNLYQRENLTGVAIDDYLGKLFKNLFDSYNIEPGRISLTTEIEKLNLDIETVIPIGLVVNELVSNSLKYAFPGERIGQIEIRLQEIDDVLELIVKDNGVGMSDRIKDQGEQGFGYKLINTFKSKLKADLEVTSDDGTEVRLLIHKYDKVA